MIPALAASVKRLNERPIRPRKPVEQRLDIDARSEGSVTSHGTQSSDEEYVENGKVGPVWNEELKVASSKDISMEVMAHEELGASDDEDLLGFPNFKPLDAF